MTSEQIKFFLEWAVLRAGTALLENDIVPNQKIQESLNRQIMSLMTQVNFRLEGLTND